MERPHQPVLHRRIQVDQQVATGNQVNLGKWRMLDNAMRGKHAHLAYFWGNAIIVAFNRKPAFEARVRYTSDWLTVAANARHRNRALVKISAEDLHFGPGPACVHRFA